jgi:hypothetical protein
MKKMLIIFTIALATGAIAFVGVPAYKAWATTSACLTGEDAYWIESSIHQYYPCGWIFYVTHKGDGGSDPCDCDHHRPTYVNLQIWNVGHTQLKRTQACSFESTNECDGVDERLYCAVAHVPNGSWEYRFICSNGESTDYKQFDPYHPNCTEAIWASDDCEP